jgi:hypothetical protein
MNKNNKEITISNMITLCHIIDEFDEFEKRLIPAISPKYNRNFISQIWSISTGKFKLGAKKAKKFYEICCSNAKHTKLVDQYILPLWSACNCKEAIYERRSHIDILKYFGNKDFFPTFYTLLSENNLIQNEETISDKQN